jgi:cytochrome c556
MMNLVRAVVLLDRRTIRSLAQRIAEEEIVARAGSPALGNARPYLPEAFFQQQEVLRAAAQDLAAAADATPETRDNDRVIAEKFAAVAQSCVACHSAYRRGDLPP